MIIKMYFARGVNVKMCLCPEAFNVHLILHVDDFDKFSMLSKSIGEGAPHDKCSMKF